METGTVPGILFWWILFAGTHLLGSFRPVRDFLVRTTGLRGFKGLYSAVALATFLPLCFLFFSDKHAGALLFTPPDGFRLLTQALMFLALLFLVQGLTTPNPAATLVEMTGMGAGRPRGILRVTRHPVNTAYVLFGLGHCLSNPFAGDWLFFGGFVVFPLLGALHQDRRCRRDGPGTVRELLAATSLVPFAAILAGRQRLRPREFHPFGLAAAVLLFLALRYFHASLFGGFAD